MKVPALPFTTARPMVAEGFAPTTAVEGMQVPERAKQPEVRFTPFAWVVVAEPAK